MTDFSQQYLLIFPPLEYFGSVQLAIPTLNAQLHKAGYKTKVFDYNIDFFIDVLDKEFIQAAIDENDIIYSKIKNEKIDLLNNTFDESDRKLLAKRIEKFEKYIKNKYIFEKVPNYIEQAIQTLKTEQFYDKKKYKKAYYIIQLAMHIISLKYSPITIKNAFYIDYNEDLTYGYVKKIVLNSEYNIFLDYYKDKLVEISKYNPKLVAISISYPSQLLAGLTLAYLVKKHTNSHVTIGGSLFTRKLDFLRQNTEFFDIFADSIIWGEGENAIVELADYIENKREIENVSNLVYKKNNNIVQNSCQPIHINGIASPTFVDYDLSKYYSPNIILPIEIQRSCYWGKCSFCDINYAKSNTKKSLQKIIDEIKEYKEKYGIENFVIVDSATTPSFLNDFADEIIKNNLKIKFYTDARLEKQFTYKLFKKAYNAGLRCIGWGVESTVPRISELMNKNFNKKDAIKIIKDADKAGIWNNVYIIVGFPLETKEEALQNVEFIKKYKKIIHSACVSKFGLYKYTQLYNSNKDYGLETSDTLLTLNMDINFKKNIGMSEDDVKDVIRIFDENRKFLYEFYIHNCSYSQWAQYLFYHSLNDIKRAYNKQKLEYKISKIKNFIKAILFKN